MSKGWLEIRENIAHPSTAAVPGMILLLAKKVEKLKARVGMFRTRATAST